ncbi:hypothetical protein RFI_27570, partial [Reticulomyxa filosa]
IPRLLLFDVDGTLLRSRHKHKLYSPLLVTLNETFGLSISTTEGVLFDGLTDRLILRKLLEYNESVHKIDLSSFKKAGTYEEYIVKAAQNIAKYHEDAISKGISSYEILPHVDKLLTELTTRPKFHQKFYIGLLSGNMIDSIPIKFHNAKINLKYFNTITQSVYYFSNFHFFKKKKKDGKSHLLGAFGSDAENRNDLVKFAKQRFAFKLGIKPEQIGNDRLLIIGDTPKDIECAHSNQVACVAVATGIYSVKDLQTAGADVVLESFEDWEKAIQHFDTCQYTSK